MNRAFCAAIKDGQLVQAKQLLSNGADLNSVMHVYDETTLPAFFEVIHNNDEKTVGFLIKNGLNVNQGISKVLKSIPLFSSSFTKRDNYSYAYSMSPGATALHCAAITLRPNSNIMQQLLEAKGDINHQNRDKQTPLVYAMIALNEVSTKCLIENNANLDTKNIDGKTPLEVTESRNINFPLYAERLASIRKLYEDALALRARPAPSYQMR